MNVYICMYSCMYVYLHLLRIYLEFSSFVLSGEVRFASCAERFCGEQQLDLGQCERFTSDARAKYVTHRLLRHPLPERDGEGIEIDGSGSRLLVEDDGFFEFFQEAGSRAMPFADGGAGGGDLHDLVVVVSGSHTVSYRVVDSKYVYVCMYVCMYV